MSDLGANDPTMSIRCAKCDYDVSDLAIAGVCPECALPIAESIRIASLPRMPSWLVSARVLHVLCVVAFTMGMFVDAAPQVRTLWSIELAAFGAAVACFGIFLARKSKPFGRDRLPLILTAIQAGLLLVTFQPWRLL